MEDCKQLMIDFDNNAIIPKPEDIVNDVYVVGIDKGNEWDTNIVSVSILEPINGKNEDKSDHKIGTNKCKHSVKIKSYSRHFLSYCSKCGKILSVKRKKGE